MIHMSLNFDVLPKVTLMKSNNWWKLCPFLVLWSLGCGTHYAELDTQRAKYLLADEPPGAVGVLDLRESISGDQQVVLVGQIGGIADPWSRGQASFVIMDPVSLMEGEGHSENCACPFCRQSAEETEGLALVQFLDDSGEVLSVDAQRLFCVSKDQMVVVQGHAKLDQLGHLIVAAHGLYIRR
ncbi:MAG: hypothetical protein CMJ81_12505 [Planctomycetaceae bacterium]|nr:hypothetical protein [Planctomycetaceae bacterium]